MHWPVSLSFYCNNYSYYFKSYNRCKDFVKIQVVKKICSSFLIWFWWRQKTILRRNVKEEKDLFKFQVCVKIWISMMLVHRQKYNIQWFFLNKSNNYNLFLFYFNLHLILSFTPNLTKVFRTKLSNKTQINFKR